MTENDSGKKVFISYSWDSDEHKVQVLTLANGLRKTGVDVILDRYEESPKKGWPIWMQESIENAKYVLIICTEKYLNRFLKKEVTKGKGVTFEGAIITQDLYDFNGENEKFIPVIIKPSDEIYIPKILKSYTVYKIYQKEDYNKLYARLTEQQYIEKPALGKIININNSTSIESNLPEYKVSNLDELLSFLQKQEIKSLNEAFKIGIGIDSNKTLRAEEILKFRFIMNNRNNDICILISENKEGLYEIRLIADASRINGKQIKNLASEINQNICNSISNLVLQDSLRNDLCEGQMIRYIMTYDY